MSRFTRLLAALGALLTAAGCTVTAVTPEEDTRVRNQCSSRQDCDGGACVQGACEALETDIPSLLFEVTPPAAGDLSRVSYLVTQSQVPEVGESLQISVSPPALVTGRIALSQSDCTPSFLEVGPAEGQTLKVKARLIPSERLLGVFAQSYYVESTKDEESGEYRFTTRVPFGKYDVYIEPPIATTPECATAPQLTRGEDVSSSEVRLEYLVSPATTLHLELRYPKSSGTLTSWTADIIEPVTGLPVSSRVLMPAPESSGDNYVYKFTLAYSAPGKNELYDPAEELVRLTPPEGAIAPTVYLERSGLGLFGSEVVVIDAFQKYPAPVRVSGQLSQLANGEAAFGSVSLLATRLTGVSPGVLSSFQRSVEVEPDGKFDAMLLPGEYRVVATPAASLELASIESQWSVPDQPAEQFGKLIELPSATAVTGKAFDPRTGSPLEGAQVQTVPTARALFVNALKSALGEAPFVPRSSSALVKENGGFALSSDPGTFDLSVRAPEALGFAWYVAPAVTVPLGNLDLGSLPVPLPYVLRGNVSVPTAEGDSLPVTSALVRAYAYLDSEGRFTSKASNARSVVQVAEARSSDETGSLRLLIPASLAGVGAP